MWTNVDSHLNDSRCIIPPLLSLLRVRLESLGQRQCLVQLQLQLVVGRLQRLHIRVCEQRSHDEKIKIYAFRAINAAIINKHGACESINQNN